MRFLTLAILALTACDYASLESVDHLARKVETVEDRQLLVETRLETTSQETKHLQAGFQAMGDGFNVLADSLQEQDERVVGVERLGRRMQTDLQDVRSKLKEARRSPPPKGLDILDGVRLDIATLAETPIRLRWCEADEGVQGFLLQPGAELNYSDVQCWRFGNVALFRMQTALGPEIACLRDFEESADGRIHALDCYEPGIVYRFTSARR